MKRLLGADTQTQTQTQTQTDTQTDTQNMLFLCGVLCNLANKLLQLSLDDGSLVLL